MFDLNQAVIFYQDAFKSLRRNKSVPEILVEYYPYVNTSHTIRFRKEKIFVRISDSFECAPTEVHRALAYILMAKLLGKQVPRSLRKSYSAFVRGDSFRRKALDQKRKRGSKRISSPVGQRFDLEEIFQRLNRDYFKAKLQMPELSWSQRPAFRRLGHHDPAHDTIIISKALDTRRVPEFVVEYVLYHEMLHLVHPVRVRNGRRLIHTPDFRRDEANFDFSEEAEEWINLNTPSLKKLSKRPR